MHRLTPISSLANLKPEARLTPSPRRRSIGRPQSPRPFIAPACRLWPRAWGLRLRPVDGVRNHDYDEHVQCRLVGYAESPAPGHRGRPGPAARRFARLSLAEQPRRRTDRSAVRVAVAWARRENHRTRHLRQLPSGYPPRCQTSGCQGSSRGGGSWARHPFAGGSRPANSGDPSRVPSPATARSAACSSATAVRP
jgi:hypothetical protein